MARKNDIKLQDLMALYSAFGPQAQAERSQAARSAQLAQIASALNIAGGVQNLTAQPQEQALRRRGAEADITAREKATAASDVRGPVELEALRAQVEAARSGGALSEAQLASLREMAPLQRELASIQVQGAKAEVADRPGKLKREEEAHQSDLQYRKTLGGAQQTGALAQVLPHLESLLTLSQGTGAGKPGELVLTPEIRRGVMAKLLQIPELAAAFQTMAGQREDITRKGVEAATTPSPSIHTQGFNALVPPRAPDASWWEGLGSFGIPSR